MKKKYLLITVCILLSLTGCYKGDVNDLKDDVNGLKDDVEKLKEQMAQYETLLNALSKNLYITGYEIKDGQYVIVLSDGSSLSVRNTSTLITIGENGNWYVDGVDTKVPASGLSEVQTPTVEIKDGYWWINGENTGVKAEVENGKDAAEIISISVVDDKMTFLFSDGRTIQLQIAAPGASIAVPSGGFVYDKLKWVSIKPKVDYPDGALFTWMLDGEEISTEKDFVHIFTQAGTYQLTFAAQNSVGISNQTLEIIVNDRTYVNNVNRVYEYVPAPGQFIHDLPVWEDGDTEETMRQKAESSLKNNTMICLGGFGGYVVMGFDHTIVNKEGKDFTVLGNAFNGWAEPGIIMVSYDANGNGLPDDEWYEIAGSQHGKSTTIKNYEITYYKPEEEPSDPNERSYIRWTDNQNQSGYMAKNQYHNQSYYPQWKGDIITFKGTLLESNIYDQSGNGSYWVCPAYEWGYADNWANSDERAQIDISWAVDSKGKPANLKGVDFIKVYTANNADGGWLGEISTEIKGVTDLNL